MKREVNHYFTRVLNSHNRNKLPAKQLQSYKELRIEVATFLQQTYRLHEERVGEPVNAGSYEKGTDINLRFDLDLIVPFCHGFCKGAKGIKNRLFKDLEKRFKDRALVKNGRVAVCLTFEVPPHTIEIDVVPGMEIKPGAYKSTSKDDEGRFLVLYDREASKELVTNVQRQIRLVKHNQPPFRPVIQLLKVWKKHHDRKLSSYAIELMVYDAFKRGKYPEKKFPVEKMLLHTLEYNARLLAQNCSLKEIGSGGEWHDFVKPGNKVNLSGIFNKMAQAIRDRDIDRLKDYFPVNPKYDLP